jgi:hypothetical protein
MTSRFYFDFALPRHSTMLTTTSLSSTTAGRDDARLERISQALA